MRSLIALVALLITYGGFAAEITITAADGFELKADYYAGQSGQPGMLLLHQCDGDRSMYRDLGQSFADQGMHALALDFRGFGGSRDFDFDFAKATVGLSTREEMIRATLHISRHWPSDVDASVAFLRERTGALPLIGVGGASCGGAQATLLAMRTELGALMMLSSAIADEDQAAQIAAISPIPGLFIAAEEDGRPYRGNQALFAAAQHKQSRMVVYKGAAHASPLFDQDPTLINSIVAWFRVQLASGSLSSSVN